MKSQLSLAIAVAMAVAVSAFGAVRPAVAQVPTDPESVFRAAVDAFNRADAAATAAYFAEDATVTGLCPPANVCHGRAELQAFLEREIAEGAHDEIRELTVSGNTVSVKLTETVPAFAELGVERVYINIAATVEDGLITTMTDELDLTDAQTARFAQAMGGEEEMSLPSTGTGGQRERSHAAQSGLFLLAGLGLAFLALGVALSRSRRVVR